MIVLFNGLNFNLSIGVTIVFDNDEFDANISLDLKRYNPIEYMKEKYIKCEKIKYNPQPLKYSM
jgi:hypothetical protein